MKRVLVTGASGHIGYAVVRALAERGYEVRAGVRGATSATKSAPLRELNVEVVELDIMRPETVTAAMAGRDGLFHLAAAFKLWTRDDRAEIVDVTVQGALNVVTAAAAAGVERVVFTSSGVAAGVESRPGSPLTEQDWDLSSGRWAYCEAKAQAEHQAWQLAGRLGLDMVSILPGHVLGPYVYRHTVTTTFVQKILDNQLPGALPLNFWIVDVRDVAKAHVAAYENERAAGRYFAIQEKPIPMTRLIEIIRELDPAVKVKPEEVSWVLLKLAPTVDWLTHVVTGRPREMPRSVIAEFANKSATFDLTRSRSDLGWEPGDPGAIVADTVAWLKKQPPAPWYGTA